MQGGEKMSDISREFNAHHFCRNIKHIHINMIYRMVGELLSIVQKFIQSDYWCYIPVTSNGFTKKGIEYLN